MKPWVPASLALALAIGPLPARAAVDDETEEAGSARLRVDVSGLGSAYEHIRTDVEARVTGVIEDAGADATANVTIDWINPDDFHYAIDVRVDLGEAGKTASRSVECSGCTATDLVSQVLSTVEETIAAAKEQSPPVTEPDAEPAEAVESMPAMEPRSSDRKPHAAGLGSMGWAGVGLLVAGVAAAGTGGAFLGLGERKPEDEPTKLRDFQPPGIALVATGGVLLVTGVVLLAIDRTRARKRVAVRPGIGAGLATVSITGRF